MGVCSTTSIGISFNGWMLLSSFLLGSQDKHFFLFFPRKLEVVYKLRFTEFYFITDEEGKPRRMEKKKGDEREGGNKDDLEYLYGEDIPLFPIRKVVFAKTGIGYFERLVLLFFFVVVINKLKLYRRADRVKGSSAFELYFKSSDMNDVLKVITI